MLSPRLLWSRESHNLKFSSPPSLHQRRRFYCNCLDDEGNFNFDYRSSNCDTATRLNTHRRRHQGEWWHLLWVRYQSQPAMEKAVLAARRKWWDGIRQPHMMDRMLVGAWFIMKLKLPPRGDVVRFQIYISLHIRLCWNMRRRLQGSQFNKFKATKSSAREKSLLTPSAIQASRRSVQEILLNSNANCSSTPTQSEITTCSHKRLYSLDSIFCVCYVRSRSLKNCLLFFWIAGHHHLTQCKRSSYPIEPKSRSAKS